MIIKIIIKLSFATMFPTPSPTSQKDDATTLHQTEIRSFADHLDPSEEAKEESKEKSKDVAYHPLFS